MKTFTRSTFISIRPGKFRSTTFTCRPTLYI